MVGETDSRAAEFDLLMTRAGLSVPPDRRAGAFAVYLELIPMVQLLRQPRSVESEPAPVFSASALPTRA